MAKKQKSVNVRKLGYQEAFDILTGGSKDPKGFPKLPIDNWLKTAKLLPPVKLKAVGCGCLKTAARRAVAEAASEAARSKAIEIMAPNYPTSNNPRLSMRARGKQIAALRQKIQRTLKQMGLLSRQLSSFDLIIPFAERFSDRQDPVLIAKAGVVAADAKKAVIVGEQALRHFLLFANLEVRRCLPLGRASDPWNVGFVIVLGIFYRRVTGRNPHGNSDSFRELVASAYTSLGANDEPLWDGAIRTACKYMKNRPQWDQWDRTLSPPRGPSAGALIKRILGA